jgi:hypothetical protein
MYIIDLIINNFINHLQITNKYISAFGEPCLLYNIKPEGGKLGQDLLQHLKILHWQMLTIYSPTKMLYNILADCSTIFRESQLRNQRNMITTPFLYTLNGKI